MWDNKSKESPVNLREHLRQFDAYMDQAEKPVPIFLVIGPSFTDDSESEAIRYHARHFDRNICLITAGELKLLADEWSSQENKDREDPFPLGLLAATGRFNRTRLGKLFRYKNPLPASRISNRGSGEIGFDHHFDHHLLRAKGLHSSSPHLR